MTHTLQPITVVKGDSFVPEMKEIWASAKQELVFFSLPAIGSFAGTHTHTYTNSDPKLTYNLCLKCTMYCLFQLFWHACIFFFFFFIYLFIFFLNHRLFKQLNLYFKTLSREDREWVEDSTLEPRHEKTNKMTYAQRRRRSAWASAQSDQNLHSALNR